VKFIIDITPGDYTTEDDLLYQRENIRIELHAAVDVVAYRLFPEYTFNFQPEDTYPLASTRSSAQYTGRLAMIRAHGNHGDPSVALRILDLEPGNYDLTQEQPGTILLRELRRRRGIDT
jgi:hypothetical protein